ncbi:hypothetical protein AB0P19_02330 [Microbacterium oleivorans]|uniref:hypothetical protein n=1 Tax=Microbacterium oleivorans TaxID=273677 RepID=UPI0034127FAA
MSIDADPGNPDGTYFYDVRVRRDWADDAVEQAEKQWKDNPSRARRFIPVRVERRGR